MFEEKVQTFAYSNFSVNDKDLIRTSSVPKKKSHSTKIIFVQLWDIFSQISLKTTLSIFLLATIHILYN